MIFVKEKMTCLDTKPYMSFEIQVSEIIVEDYKVYSVTKNISCNIRSKVLLLSLNEFGMWVDSNNESWTSWKIR